MSREFLSKTKEGGGQNVTNESSTRRRSSSDMSQVDLTMSEVFRLQDKGFVVIKKIAQGVSAKIYLGSHQRDNSEETYVAIKVIDKKIADKRFLTKFLPRELEILSSLSHPHIIQIHHILHLRMKTFIVMRYAEKGDLLDYLTSHRSLELAQARMWMRQLLLAVKYLQSKFIAHRDIKCENVLITENQNAKLGDFGFARNWLDSSEKEILSETYCGSISYAAPEILMGKPYSMKYVDIWSLGVVFFIMCNYSKPFTKDRAGGLLQQQLQRQYRFKRKALKLIGTDGCDMIEKMLNPIPQERISIDDLLNINSWINQFNISMKLFKLKYSTRCDIYLYRLLNNSKEDYQSLGSVDYTTYYLPTVDYLPTLNNDTEKSTEYEYLEEETSRVKDELAILDIDDDEIVEK